MTEIEKDKMEKIVSLTKRRGFIYQGSEIYGGLAGTWDYGPLGVSLKRNVMNLWWKTFIEDKDDMYGVDAAILMNEKVWQATGHTDTFSDPLVECKKCKKQYRADHIEGKCPECDLEVSGVEQFNLMFETKVGAKGDSSSISYLRPETAQGMFVNFKNVIDSFHPKLPFGLAQMGKAFRNEIAPRDFIFRAREFEQMEIEYFVKESDWKDSFEMWRKEMLNWIEVIGISKDKTHELEVSEDDLAHYSKRTIDVEFDYPFGRDELYGLAYRTDFDLKSHIEGSKVDLSYLDQESNKKIVPHVIEPSLGVERVILAILCSAYSEDELGGEKRVFLKLSPNVAPVKVAIFPLLKNKPELVKKAKEIYTDIKKEIPQVIFDDNGNIGKRYRRQDEIGTPLCITIDFDTLDGDEVTVRDRDTGEQERVQVSALIEHIKKVLG